MWNLGFIRLWGKHNCVSSFSIRAGYGATMATQLDPLDKKTHERARLEAKYKVT